ncbi:hypothetical protein DRP05_13190 [Archaeoglobales archaeon]|nr:MAG: hypothetical protein DRP05_13190 [Archaeoglobales archaeon]
MYSHLPRLSAESVDKLSNFLIGFSTCQYELEISKMQFNGHNIAIRCQNCGYTEFYSKNIVGGEDKLGKILDIIFDKLPKIPQDGDNMKYLFAISILVVTLFIGSLQCDVKGVNAVPGETLSFNLKITNDESYERSIQPSYRAPEGFNGKFIYDGKEIEWLQLDANESKTVTFQLEVPSNAEEKEYFVSVYASGSITLRINVKMPEEPLEITPSITGIAIEAGDEVSFPILIKNKLNAEYKVDLSCLIPKNWSYRFIENGVEVYKIVLKPNEERSLTLEVESDSSADVKEYKIIPYFNKQSVDLNVKITKTHKGEHGKIKLKLIGKDGKAVGSARIEVSGFGEFFTSAEGEATIEVPQGIYKLKIMKGGYYSKEINDVEVKAGKTNDLGTITLEKRPYYAEVSVVNPKISFVIGTGNPTFRFRIENRGYADDTYKLSIEGLPENFYSKFKESQRSAEAISEVFVKSGDSKDVYLEILIPPNPKVGVYNLTLLVEGHYSVEKNLTLNLRGEYRMYFEPVGGMYLITTEAGKTAEFNDILRNVGRGATLTNINLTVSTPSNWKVSINPSSIPALEAGNSMPVKITAYIPADTLPSEYKLRVNIKSDQVNEQEEFRVIVKERSYAGIIGGAIIIAALGLTVIFRKFGRR